MKITSNFPILLEDTSLLVINKPYGVVVNRAESVKDETVQDWAEQQLKINPPIGGEESRIEEGNDFYNRVGIVHRIDKETSGCLIIAKDPEAFVKLQTAFKERTVHKTYIALVHGDIPQEGEINVPVGRLPWNKEQFGVVPGGKESRTVYKKLHIYSSREPAKPENREVSLEKKSSSRSASRRTSNNKEIFSLLELNPETGRTHQIRVHLKYLGYPIVGDYLYAGRKQQKADRVWCPRVFLHAAKVTFPHPVSGEMISAEAPLPEELESVLDNLHT